MRSLTLLCTLMLPLAVPVRPCRGQGSAPASEDAARAQAKEKARQAKERRAAGDLMGALDLYQQAYGTYPSPYLLWPQAELYLLTGRPAEARSMLDRHEHDFPQDAYPEEQGPAQISALRERIAAREAELAAPKPVPGVEQVHRVDPVPPAPRKGEGHVDGVIARGRSPRRLTWMSYTGIPLAAVGLGFLTFGGIALGADGQCTDQPCNMRYDSLAQGIGTAVTGGVLVGVGITLLAIDLRRR